MKKIFHFLWIKSTKRRIPGNNLREEAIAIEMLAANIFPLITPNKKSVRKNRTNRFSCPIPTVNLKGKEIDAKKNKNEVCKRGRFKALWRRTMQKIKLKTDKIIKIFEDTSNGNRVTGEIRIKAMGG